MATAAERMDLRIDPEKKDLLRRAAALVGSTMSDFVVRSSLESAEQVLKNHSSITLQNRSFDSFITACENSPEPNQALKAALAVTRESVIE
jgi:uncharacterized protein (DUF1778 family)